MVFENLMLAVFLEGHNDNILKAIRVVECGDVENPPDGKAGEIGPYQILECYWKEALEYMPRIGGTYEDCRKEPYARKVVEAYMRRYAITAWKNGDAEDISRTHNGGPKGIFKTSTLPYWHKVQGVLKNGTKTTRTHKR